MIEMVWGLRRPLNERNLVMSDGRLRTITTVICLGSLLVLAKAPVVAEPGGNEVKPFVSEPPALEVSQPVVEPAVVPAELVAPFHAD